MHKIQVYNRTFSQILTTLSGVNFYDLEYENELGKGGRASFKMRLRDVQANAVNIRLFNRIKIYKRDKFKFIGYIEDMDMNLNEVTIRCNGMLNMLARRNVSYHTTAGQTLTSEFYKILNQLINGVDDTGIIQGVSDSTLTPSASIELNDMSGLQAFEKLANLDNKILEIDENRKLNLKTAIGSDKSNTVIFNYNINQIPTATIFDYEVDIKGSDMANVVIGKAESLSASRTDATSIANWGRLEARENFGGTKNLTDLQNETQAYLDNHKNEVIVPKIKPNPLKIDTDSYLVGDTVRVVLDNGFIAINQKYIINKKTVKITDNLKEDVSVQLTPEGANILPSNFFLDIIKLAKRVTTVEGILYK